MVCKNVQSIAIQTMRNLSRFLIVNNSFSKTLESDNTEESDAQFNTTVTSYTFVLLKFNRPFTLLCMYSLWLLERIIKL